MKAIGSDFAIDASYELALVVGQKIHHLPLKFCLKLSPDCIVHPLSERSKCVSDNFHFIVVRNKIFIVLMFIEEPLRKGDERFNIFCREDV